MKKIEIDKIERFTGIIDSVGYWLGYQFKIGREQLIHEASLRYPIADAITSNDTSINQVELEKLHPLFKSKKIDLVTYEEDTRETLKEVYEFKLVKNDSAKEGSTEYQRVFDDVVRLAYFNKWESKDCYFLMCGEYIDFKTYFVGQKEIPKVEEDGKVKLKQDQFKEERKDENCNEIVTKWEPESLFKDWFAFKVGNEMEIIFKTDEEYGLKEFQSNYKIRDTDKYKFVDEIRIKTTCMAITPSGIEDSRTHAVGIWKIEYNK